MTVPDPADCVFCNIANGSIPADLVFEDPDFMGFLDTHPLFPGHILLCPRTHYVTLLELPGELAGAAMTNTQLLAKAVESALDAEGTFIAINNRVSQTVPHLHIHIVPRRRRDGLRGFFWPRQKYQDESAKEAVRDAIEREVRRLTN
ncbi:MAG TPA: HIT family protein [Bryobacteraceae bacterium]|nr:HIT family protein [Bryobacteraceae bacterium]